MRKSFKYRLYPTKPQARDLERTLELCRQLYNAALQERRDAYRKAGKAVGFYEQKRHLPVIRRDLPEYKGIHSQVLQEVIQRVDRAFQGFFRRVKQGQKPGYPRFKGKGRYDSFTFPQAGSTGVKVQEGGKRVFIHGIGSVKVKLHRPLEEGEEATGQASPQDRQPAQGLPPQNSEEAGQCLRNHRPRGLERPRPGPKPHRQGGAGCGLGAVSTNPCLQSGRSPRKL